LLAGIPVLSPLAWPLSYRYPVHRIKPDYQPQQPPVEATHLLVYRNRQNQVKFMSLNDVSRLLLEFMQEDQAASGLDLLQRVANAIGHSDHQKVITAGAVLLADLKTRDVLLGTRKTA
jgi:hypothetical protein